MRTKSRYLATAYSRKYKKTSKTSIVTKRSNKAIRRANLVYQIATTQVCLINIQTRLCTSLSLKEDLQQSATSAHPSKALEVYKIST